MITKQVIAKINFAHTHTEAVFLTFNLSRKLLEQIRDIQLFMKEHPEIHTVSIDIGKVEVYESGVFSKVVAEPRLELVEGCGEMARALGHEATSKLQSRTTGTLRIDKTGLLLIDVEEYPYWAEDKRYTTEYFKAEDLEKLLYTTGAIELIILEDDLLEMVITDRNAFNDIVDSWKNKESTNIERDILVDLLEDARYIGNDWHVIDFMLSDALGIAYGAIYDTEEQDEPNDYENVWFYDSGNQSFFHEDLLENGGTIWWTKVRD